MTGMGNPPLAGRYLLIDQIGAGGMGSVWRAWDLRNQTFVAAKVLGQHDSGMLLRFVREQSVRIRHPHVVAPSGWAAEDHLVVFTMDLVRGGSVQTLLGDHGTLPESYVAVVLDQTLQALEAVHHAGVVHRDVKPANLLLEPTGTRRPHVRLGDFGVAALIDEVRLTRFPGAIGTDGYMAPEQAHGAAPEPRQDLYALGVVGVQMLTGLGPRHQKGVPDGALEPLLESLLEVDSEKRPESASAALDTLRAIGVPGAPPGSRRRSRPRSSTSSPTCRRRLRARLAAAHRVGPPLAGRPGLRRLGSLREPAAGAHVAVGAAAVYQGQPGPGQSGPVSPPSVRSGSTLRVRCAAARVSGGPARPPVRPPSPASGQPAVRPVRTASDSTPRRVLSPGGYAQATGIAPRATDALGGHRVLRGRGRPGRAAVWLMLGLKQVSPAPCGSGSARRPRRRPSRPSHRTAR